MFHRSTCGHAALQITPPSWINWCQEFPVALDGSQVAKFLINRELDEANAASEPLSWQWMERMWSWKKTCYLMPFNGLFNSQEGSCWRMPEAVFLGLRYAISKNSSSWDLLPARERWDVDVNTPIPDKFGNIHEYMNHGCSRQKGGKS